MLFAKQLAGRVVFVRLDISNNFKLDMVLIKSKSKVLSFPVSVNSSILSLSVPINSSSVPADATSIVCDVPAFWVIRIARRSHVTAF